MPWSPLGHDGPQGPEGHQPVLHTYAYCGWWSKPMWVVSPAWLFLMRNYYVLTCFWLFLHCFDDIFMYCLFSGSVSSCDAFLNVFQSHGLKPEVICPCATSPEALTVAIRRYHVWILSALIRVQMSAVLPANNKNSLAHSTHYWVTYILVHFK